MPRVGLMNTISSAVERLRSDSTLMLAVTHHLVFGYGLRFDTIVDGIRALTRLTAYVEFVSPEDVHVKEWDPDRYPWYNLDQFLAALSRKFSSVEVISFGNADRVIIRCLVQ